MARAGAAYAESAWSGPVHDPLPTDRPIGELDRLGLTKDTIVFFASDNGAEKKPFSDIFRSNASFRGNKGTVYEGGLRVPMLVRWPGVVRSGKVSSTAWWFADVFPTFLALAGGADAKTKLDGEDISPVLRGEDQPSLANRYLYWEDPGKRLVQGVRRGNWKAVRTGLSGALELYDLKNDIGETRDVAAANPDVVADFMRYLATARVPSPHWPDAP